MSDSYEWGFRRRELRVDPYQAVARFDAAEKIPAGSLVATREDGAVRAAAPGEIPIGVAVRCERGGNGGLICDVRIGVPFAGEITTIDEPDVAEDFARRAEASLAVVRRQERIVRRRDRAKRRKRKGR